jgi:Holliday junction resolvase RusA-like endonuclease
VLITAIDPGTRESAFVVDVIGEPAPKGSSRAILRGGHAVNVPGGSNVNLRKIQAWTRAVEAQAGEAMAGRRPFVDAPLVVSVLFRIERPGGQWRKGRYGEALKPTAPAFPATRPDIDKLARSTLDALTGIAWDDDSRIVILVAGKVYAKPGHAGAMITVARRMVGDADGLSAGLDVGGGGGCKIRGRLQNPRSVAKQGGISDPHLQQGPAPAESSTGQAPADSSGASAKRRPARAGELLDGVGLGGGR